jgi:glycosyltransferase involved in cell wall biosynthesis
MPPLRILYDHQVFDVQRYGGISRYFSELINELLSDEDVCVRLGMRFSSNGHISNQRYAGTFTDRRNVWLGMGRALDMIDGASGTGAARMRRLLGIAANNRRTSSKAIEHGDFDVLHPTYYDPYFLSHLKGRPFVLTIHDMIHERFAAGAKDDPTIARKKELATKADRIIVVSESTKRDVVEMLGIPSDKIHVTYLANSLQAPSTRTPLKGMPESYLLYVGDRRGYKSFTFMLQALDQVFARYQDLNLLCVGGPAFTETERRMIEASRGSGRIKRIHVSDDELAQLYSGALVYINPSQYEGFGLPVLEAMACRCPTLLSRVSSLPEVGGPAARYFEVNDQRSFLDALLPLLEDEELRERMKEAGVKQAAKFSWKETARRTKAVYMSLT